jgi:hypothetical protein
MSSLWASKGAK